MAGISSKAAGKLENKFKYNDGTELNTDFDLSWYETTFRGYDPQIGRFHQIDALTDISPEWSPYSFVQNNPILYVDPYGLDTFNVNNIPTDRQFNETDILTNDNGSVVGYWNGEGWHQGYANAGNATVTAKKKSNSQEGVMGLVHTSLDIVGMVPGVGEWADGINAGIYAVQGDYKNASLSLAAMIPVAGIAATGAKLLGGATLVKTAIALTQRETKVYKIFKTATGEVHKYGIHSKNIFNVYGKRMENQVAKLGSAYSGEYLQTFSTRAPALNAERYLTTLYKYNNTFTPMARPAGNALPKIDHILFW